MGNNSQHLLDIEKDEVFNGVLALRACSKRIKTNGEPYLSLELGDSSGRMPAVYWGNDAGAVFKEIESAMAVHVRGVISEYRDKPQFTVESIRIASQAEIDKAELLPVGSFSREQLENRLRSAIVTVENRFLRKLLDVIFGEADFRKAFLRAPAGKLWHGAYIGGLAEHSMNVAVICESAVPMFPLCRRDLLFACALLHDIGKVDEIQISEHFDYSVEGRLVGHIVIGERRIRAAIREIEDFPEEMALEISHMILSHHGEREMGSPVEPMTIEASILHHADLLESQANAFSHVVSRDLENAGPFSQWVDPVSRFLYKEAYNKGQST